MCLRFFYFLFYPRKGKPKYTLKMPMINVAYWLSSGLVYCCCRSISSHAWRSYIRPSSALMRSPSVITCKRFIENLLCFSPWVAPVVIILQSHWTWKVWQHLSFCAIHPVSRWFWFTHCCPVYVNLELHELSTCRRWPGFHRWWWLCGKLVNNIANLFSMFNSGIP